MASPRTESLGNSIRADHRIGCAKSAARCDCPKSWPRPTINATRLPRRTGFIGTLTDARQEKAREADELRTAHDRRRADRAASRRRGGNELFFTYYKRWMKHGKTKGWAPDTYDGREGAYRLR